MSFVFLVDEDMLHNQIIDSSAGDTLTSIGQSVNSEEEVHEFSSFIMGKKPKLSISNNGNYNIG